MDKHALAIQNWQDRFQCKQNDSKT